MQFRFAAAFAKFTSFYNITKLQPHLQFITIISVMELNCSLKIVDAMCENTVVLFEIAVVTQLQTL
jgi:hypothetical protein